VDGGQHRLHPALGLRRTAEPCWSTRRRARRWCSHELFGTMLERLVGRARQRRPAGLAEEFRLGAGREGGQVQHSGYPSPLRVQDPQAGYY
jgi:hypothetical protein